MDESPAGRAKATLAEGDVEFDTRDAVLLRMIHRTGSVAAAATELGRSRARALSRIEALEAAFGPLVERRRGGSGGGGSRLTGTGRRLLDRYDRLSAAVSATATVPETVLSGVVREIDGEMATLETDVGRFRGLHEGVAVGDDAHIRIGADAVTLHESGAVPEPDATSARNRLEGVVAGVDSGETVFTVRIDVPGERDGGSDGGSDSGSDGDDITFRALLTKDSARRLDVESGCEVALTWKATATRVIQGVSGNPTRSE
ncbi:N-terminal domain of molybdenum-binding protein [Halalkaliarchaeum sp. AArc-CO]|uniref:LysR family transcriptional regulator n=1 Tax=Halalkaliarchaeum sp. AArc-CO TaxID=2866381 RepID=UPI00217E1996|nr:LysR family transcriptional regulator [Halalkaliarchaeum sp. AArc-CO]UWG51762.1 N-terminal domain of molybdenum-binding protein [Halalkaliarchaeum sp. AArc-CO]